MRKRMSKHENEDPCLYCDGEVMCACSGCPVLEKRIIGSVKRNEP